MAELIYLENVRLSFPHIIEPQKREGMEPSYNAEFIMPQDHPGFQKFMTRFAELAVMNAKEHASAVTQMIQQDLRNRCFGRGEEKVNKKTYQVYDGYAGQVFISASKKVKDGIPQIIRHDGTAVDPSNTMEYQALARKMYGGCRVNVAIKPWWQKPNPQKGYGNGIRSDLIAIQFAADDHPFGEGVVDASGMFGTVALTEHNASAAAPTMPPPPSFAPPVMPSAPFPAPTGLPPFLS